MFTHIRRHCRNTFIRCVLSFCMCLCMYIVWIRTGEMMKSLSRAYWQYPWVARFHNCILSKHLSCCLFAVAAFYRWRCCVLSWCFFNPRFISSASAMVIDWSIYVQCIHVQRVRTALYFCSGGMKKKIHSNWQGARTRQGTSLERRIIEIKTHKSEIMCKYFSWNIYFYYIIHGRHKTHVTPCALKKTCFWWVNESDSSSSRERERVRNREDEKKQCGSRLAHFLLSFELNEFHLSHLT